jgi:virulence-associated protein VapD
MFATTTIQPEDRKIKCAKDSVPYRILQRHGFAWQQGSVYFGGESVTAVTCVLAAIDLANSLPWFAASVRDIRMLRIEELNDLMPAVKQAVGGQP